jgi:hypothetical protein
MSDAKRNKRNAHYFVLLHRDVDVLEAMVNSCLRDGCDLVGGINSYVDEFVVWSQAMVRHEYAEEEKQT